MRIKVGDIYHAAGRRRPRHVLKLIPDRDSYRVYYATGGGQRRTCLYETFRRWVKKSCARRLQRFRLRELALKG